MSTSSSPRTSFTSRPMPSLPPEIIATILQQADMVSVDPVSDADEATTRDTQTMAAACLVSRTFLPIARRLLYATIRLKVIRRPAREEEDEMAHDMDPSSYTPTGDTLALVEAATSPHLSALAHTLVVDTDGGMGDTLADAVADVLEECTGIHQAVIIALLDPGTSTNALLNAFAIHGDHIRRLRMTRCVSFQHTPDNPPLHCAFESPDDFVLDYCCIQLSEEESSVAAIPSSLRRYHHFGSHMYTSPHTLLHHSFHTLQHLELYLPSASTYDDFDLSRCTKLAALQFRVAKPSLAKADALLRMLVSMQKLDALHTIELTVHGRHQNDDEAAEEDRIAFHNHLTAGRLFRRLPPSTTSLYLISHDFPVDTIFSWVGDLPLEPSLRHFSPPMSYWIHRMMAEQTILKNATLLKLAELDPAEECPSVEQVDSVGARTTLCRRMRTFALASPSPSPYSTTHHNAISSTRTSFQPRITT